MIERFNGTYLKIRHDVKKKPSSNNNGYQMVRTVKKLKARNIRMAMTDPAKHGLILLPQ